MILFEHIAETGGVIIVAIIVIAVPVNAIDALRERRRRRMDEPPRPRRGVRDPGTKRAGQVHGNGRWPALYCP